MKNNFQIIVLVKTNFKRRSLKIPLFRVEPRQNEIDPRGFNSRTKNGGKYAENTTSPLKMLSLLQLLKFSQAFFKCFEEDCYDPIMTLAVMVGVP